MQAPRDPAALEPRARLLLAVAAAGLVARLVLSALSQGTNDAYYWEQFGRAVVQGGTAAAYELPHFNHPPLATAWAALTWWLADLTGLRHAPLLRLAPIAADALTAALLWQVARPRGATAAAGLVALFAWNPVALLVGAFHGNTDNVVAALCLLAAWLLHARRAALGAGLALSAALHVKLIPVVLVLPLLACCRDRRELTRFALGLLAVALPLSPWTALDPRFLARVAGYVPQPEPWGLFAFLLGSLDNPALERPARVLLHALRGASGPLLLALSGLLAWRARRLALDPLEAATLGLSLFLVLATGFGLQYTVLVVPLLTAVRPGVAARYSLLAAALLLVAYATYLRQGLPLTVVFPPGLLPMPAPLFGLLAWAVLVADLTRRLLSPPGACSGASALS